MTSEPWELEPPPWDPEAEPVARSRPGDPARPMTQKQLDTWISMPPETRVYAAYQCMFNIMAEDGIGLGSGTFKQCRTRIADPTRSRYCMEHAEKMGVEYFSPGEYSELSAGEASANLTRLVPKAVRTLEDVMEDMDAPPGVRAKAADSVLDRTGYAKGVDVRLDAEVAVIDITSVIRERLDALKDAKLAEHGFGPASTPTGPSEPSGSGPGVPAITTVPGTVVPEPSSPLRAESFADETIPPPSAGPESPVAETPPPGSTLDHDDDPGGDPDRAGD